MAIPGIGILLLWARDVKQSLNRSVKFYLFNLLMMALACEYLYVTKTVLVSIYVY
jgi:hypothetical protein